MPASASGRSKGHYALINEAFLWWHCSMLWGVSKIGIADLAPMTYFGLVFCILAVAVSIYVQKRNRCYWSRKSSGASTVPGLPLLGNTVSLATQGARFVHSCKRLVRQNTGQQAHSDQQCLTILVNPMQHGDVFKVNLAGQQMTYLLHPDSIKLFFTAPDDQIAFRHAV